MVLAAVTLDIFVENTLLSTLYTTHRKVIGKDGVLSTREVFPKER